MRRLDKTVYITLFLSMPNHLYGFDSISRFADLCKALMCVVEISNDQIRNYIRCNFSLVFWSNFLDFFQLSCNCDIVITILYLNPNNSIFNLSTI